MIRISCKRCGYSGRHRKQLARCPFCGSRRMDSPPLYLTRRLTSAEHYVPEPKARVLTVDATRSRGPSPLAAAKRALHGLRVSLGKRKAKEQRAEAEADWQRRKAAGEVSVMEALRRRGEGSD